MYTEAKTATGLDGRKMKVGDEVECVSYYNQKSFGTKVKITRMHKQGLNGTIITLDSAPDPQYPHHCSHRASYAIKA